MVNKKNAPVSPLFATNDETLLVDKNNRMCIYNDLVEGVIFTKKVEFESLVEDLTYSPDTEYSTWGGKQGYLSYLKKYIKKEDKYFRKNMGQITLKNRRYQDYCDDMVLYVALKHVVKGCPIPVIQNKDFEHIDSMIPMYKHEPRNTILIN